MKDDKTKQLDADYWRQRCVRAEMLITTLDAINEEGGQTYEKIKAHIKAYFTALAG